MKEKDKKQELEAPPEAVMSYLLQRAVNEGNVKYVEALVSQGVDLHSDDDAALRVAVSEGDVGISRVLLDGGADVFACEGEPLRSAAANGDTEMVGLLMEHGAADQD